MVSAGDNIQAGPMGIIWSKNYTKELVPPLGHMSGLTYPMIVIHWLRNALVYVYGEYSLVRMVPSIWQMAILQKRQFYELSSANTHSGWGMGA